MKKPDIKIQHINNKITIVAGGKTRQLYLLLSIFLGIVVLVSFDFSYDLKPERVLGTVCFLILFAICLIVGLFQKTFYFDLVDGTVVENYTLINKVKLCDDKKHKLGSEPRFEVTTIFNYTYTQKDNIVTKQMKYRRKCILLCVIKNTTLKICEGDSSGEMRSIQNYLNSIVT